MMDSSTTTKIPIMFKNIIQKVDYLFRKRGISITSLTIIVALYQASILNLTYYKQVLDRLPLDSFNNILFFGSMPLVIFLVLFVVLNLLCFKSLIKLGAIAFIILGSLLTYFMSEFGIVIDRSIIESSLKTTQAESLSYFNLNLLLTFLITGLIPALFVLLIKIKPYQYSVFYFLKRIASAVVSLLIIALLAFVFYKDYAAFMRNNNIVLKYLMPSNYIGAVYSEYKFIKYSNLPHITIGEDIKQVKNLNNKGKKTIFVLIVGETARAKNFSLNGYEKNTNPLLSKRDDLINFNDASSCGTYTAYSVPCMFSNMARKEYDASLAKRQDNLLDLFKRADVNVTWIDNDSGCQGVCENVKTIDATDKYLKEKSPLCDSGTCYDEVLISELKNELIQIKSGKTESNGDELIVLHMIGSHGPTYYQRYPEQFKLFTPSCDTNEINRCENEALENTYNNTVAYTDYIVNEAITTLQGYEDDYNVGLIYLSDHGESLGENGVYLHSLPYSIAPETQTQIPFMMWLSKNYQQAQQIDYNCLSKMSQSAAYSQDNLFHTLLSGFNLQTKEYQSKLDLFSACKA